jgi:spermidine synthase
MWIGMSRGRKSDAPMLAGATMSEYRGVRYLHLGTPWIQGAMRLSKPLHIELDYVQRMMAWLLWLPEAQWSQGHAVQLGLGAAALTRFCHKTLRMRTTAVEINPTVIGACRLWFHLPDNDRDGGDRRLTVLEGDAGRWVADAAHRASVQVLNVDLYDHEAASPVLDSEAFYRDCRAVLADGGLMTVNLFGRDASFERSAGHIAAAFGADRVWPLAPTREGNTIVVAGRGVTLPEVDELSARAATIEARFGLPAHKWLRLRRPLRLADVPAGPTP